MRIAKADGYGTNDIERVTKASSDDGVAVGGLGGERAGDDGQLVVGLDEAQLLDETVVTHVSCAGELITIL